MATHAQSYFRGSEGVNVSDFCGQVSFGGYQGHWNLGFNSVPMGIPSGLMPPELFRSREADNDIDSDSDSDGVIVNVGATTIEPEQGFRPRGLIFSIGPMEDNVLYSDGMSLDSLESETSDDEGNCMHFATHPPDPGGLNSS